MNIPYHDVSCRGDPEKKVDGDIALFREMASLHRERSLDQAIRYIERVVWTELSLVVPGEWLDILINL